MYTHAHARTHTHTRIHTHTCARTHSHTCTHTHTHQIQRYNVLLQTIRGSLVELEKGIKGLVVMSSDLEEVFTCIHNAEVPPQWSKVGTLQQQHFWAFGGVHVLMGNAKIWGELFEQS